MQTPIFLITANMGGCGNNWFAYIFSKMDGIGHLESGVPGLKSSVYHNKIATDAELMLFLELNIRYRKIGPIDALLQEMMEVYPNKPFYVIPHYYTAESFAESCRRYPPRTAPKVLYTYGCPLKRFRAQFKCSAFGISLGTLQVDDWATDHKSFYPVSAELISKTERQFGFTMTGSQVSAIALNLFMTLEVIRDLMKAEVMGFRVVNFEELKVNRSLFEEVLAWASNDRISVDKALLDEVYSKPETLGTNTISDRSRHWEIDDNMDAMIKAPYDSKAIWDTLKAWQQFYFQECMKTLDFDYIDFYKERGIDVSFMRGS